MVDIERLYSQQLMQWAECRQRYEQLSQCEQKQLAVNGRTFIVSYNPARARSAKAVVVDGKALSGNSASADERPCFLCRHALPAEQLQVDVETLPSHHHYILAVNPYPIVDRHFTIISAEHVRQDFRGRMWDMAFFADLFPDYLIFFNGARSGASAPDHMHFQAVPKASVPMLGWTEEQKLELGVTRQLPNVSDSDDCNILTWTEGTEAFWLVIHRRCHRPSQYFLPDDDPDKYVFSPASLEFCGLVPLCREEDYRKITASALSQMLSQCQRQEPLIRVGIMEGQQIRFSAEERVHSMNYVADGQMKDVMDYSTNRSELHEMTDYWCHMEPFTLEGVTIGKQFHWQKQEDQVFRGSLHIIAAEGKLHAINLIRVEEYLKSVIASEMSATNSLELLKAHAIISRSWVLRQLNHKPSGSAHDSNGECSCSAAASDSVIKYWDHTDHTLYDVCADDHCQRYQGIVRESSPLVIQAVELTRGMVLTDADGSICDARFSKCCGGKTEIYSTCWQDQDYSYLQSVDDPYCSPDFISQLPGGMDAVMQMVLNDYDQSTQDYHDWTVSYSQDELSDLIELKLGLGLGQIISIQPLERGASGRVKLMRVVGSQRTVTLGKELLIRKALSATHLYSSWFDVEKVEEQHAGADSRPTIFFHFHGHGWGHGVGLCQIGAAAMALQGFTAQQILSHYYPGSCLSTLY